MYHFQSFLTSLKRLLFVFIISFMQEKTLDFTEIWETALNTIKTKISEEEFHTWFERIRFSCVDGNEVKLFVPSAFFRDGFERKQYTPLIENAISEITKKTYKITFEIKKEDSHQTAKKQVQKTEKTVVTEEKTKAPNPTLNPAYTFESFVPGENSNFAYSAAFAIAKNPGSVYNPCLLYGGVGLGKTHLLQSIGNYVHENTELKVVYVTAENFTNDFIQSVNDNTTKQFKNKYRKASVLLIDDIQFLQKKDGTQQELFSTFNDLYDTGRQIVFTCDRPVEELKDITERLKSRFERGLNIDIQPPNYETRVAILQKKCRERNFTMSQDVIDFIAQNISTNVRALEACITKLMAFSELLNQDISLETAKQQLKQIISSNNDTSGISMYFIINEVANYFNVSPYDIKGKSKNQGIVIPRQIAMYLCRQLTDFSTTEIASEFGGKNHTTVMYNVQKMESLIKSNSNDVALTIDKLTSIIKTKSMHK